MAHFALVGAYHGHTARVEWNDGTLTGDPVLVARVQALARAYDGVPVAASFAPSTTTADEHLASPTSAYALMHLCFLETRPKLEGRVPSLTVDDVGQWDDAPADTALVDTARGQTFSGRVGPEAHDDKGRWAHTGRAERTPEEHAKVQQVRDLMYRIHSGMRVDRDSPHYGEANMQLHGLYERHAALTGHAQDYLAALHAWHQEAQARFHAADAADKAANVAVHDLTRAQHGQSRTAALDAQRDAAYAAATAASQARHTAADDRYHAEQVLDRATHPQEHEDDYLVRKSAAELQVFRDNERHARDMLTEATDRARQLGPQHPAHDDLMEQITAAREYHAITLQQMQDAEGALKTNQLRVALRHAREQQHEDIPQQGIMRLFDAVQTHVGVPPRTIEAMRRWEPGQLATVPPMRDLLAIHQVAVDELRSTNLLSHHDEQLRTTVGALWRDAIHREMGAVYTNYREWHRLTLIPEEHRTAGEQAALTHLALRVMGTRPPDEAAHYLHAATEYTIDRRYTSALAGATQRALTQVRPFGEGDTVGLDAMGGAHPGDARYADEQRAVSIAHTAAARMPRDWIAASRDAGTVLMETQPTNVAQGSTAYYDHRGGNGIIAMPVRHDGKPIPDGWVHDTALHELGHRVEATVPKVSQAEQAFMGRRTANEQPITLAGFDGRYTPDRFIDAYVGREDYGVRPNGPKGASYRPYEILTRGEEAILGRERTALTLRLRDDPDFHAFVLGLLATA